MLSNIAGALEQLGIALNSFVGGYEQRVRKGLIRTGDDIVNFLILIELEGKKEKKRKHFIRKWKADRSRLK